MGRVLMISSIPVPKHYFFEFTCAGQIGSKQLDASRSQKDDGVAEQISFCETLGKLLENV